MFLLWLGGRCLCHSRVVGVFLSRLGGGCVSVMAGW